MTRIPLSTGLKVRTGAPSGKDARLNNAYVEVKGEQTMVRKRPGAQGGVAVGSGTAQGMIGFNIAGVDKIIGVWGDVLTNYTGGGTNWSASSWYMVGDHVSVDFVDYWSVIDSNLNNNPVSSPSIWSRYVISETQKYTTSPSAGVVVVSWGESTVTYPNAYTTTRNWQIIRVSDSSLLSSGSGFRSVGPSTWNGIPVANVAPIITYSHFPVTSAEAVTIRNGLITSGFTFNTIPPGYDYYFIDAYGVYNGAPAPPNNYTGSGVITGM